jgi:hypothetical protein
VSLSTGGGHFAPPTFELAAFGTNAGGWSSDDLYPRKLADVSGDGVPDIVGFASNGVYVSLATGFGHFAPPTFELAAFGTNAGGWSSQNTYPRELADFNGDRLADIFGFSQAGVYVSFSNGTGFSQPMLMSSGGDTDLSFASSFSGTVAGMSGQDTPSFTDPSFATGQTPMSGAMADSTPSANTALLGNYLASTFASSSDGYGGTSVVASQAADVSQNTLLTQPQHA